VPLTGIGGVREESRYLGRRRSVPGHAYARTVVRSGERAKRIQSDVLLKGRRFRSGLVAHQTGFSIFGLNTEREYTGQPNRMHSGLKNANV
jgi:hypothetical protein